MMKSLLSLTATSSIGQHHMAGKGDDPRPFSIPRSEYERKWNNINWKKKPNKQADNERKQKRTNGQVS